MARRKIESPLEKHEEADIIDAYQMAGCIVVSFSQPRNTMQSLGIPDLKVYDPKTGTHWWHEVKRRQGPEYKKATVRQSQGQKQFQEICESCGEEYLIGPLDVAINKLRAIGRIK